MKKFIKELFERCLAEADVNSRLIFLLHGIAAAVSLIALTIAFIVALHKEGYPSMVASVGGSGAAAAVGRYFTKKNGGDDDHDGSAKVDAPK